MSRSDCETRERGFMLTDAIVALFILSSVSVSLVAGFRLASGEAHASATMASALLVGQGCMEMTNNRSETSVVPRTSGDFTQQRSITLIPREAAQLVQLVRIRCVVSWSVGQENKRALVLERIDVAQNPT